MMEELVLLKTFGFDVKQEDGFVCVSDGEGRSLIVSDRDARRIAIASLVNVCMDADGVWNLLVLCNRNNSSDVSNAQMGSWMLRDWSLRSHE